MCSCKQRSCCTRSVTHFSSTSKDSKRRKRVSSARAFKTLAHWRELRISPDEVGLINNSLHQVNRSQGHPSRPDRLDSERRSGVHTPRF